MKTEVYSWRVSTDMKTELEREARRRKTPLSGLLDLAARELLNKSGAESDGEEEQCGSRRQHSIALAPSRAVTAIVPKRPASKCAGGCAYGGRMAASALIDTGAILALLDKTDRWHSLCVAAFPQVRLALLTSAAVLTELFHLVGDSRRQMEAAWKFVRSGAINLATIENSELPQLQALRFRFGHRPMDFADATLVYLAKRERLFTIFTVDRADFEAYRIGGRRRFRVLPSARP